MDHKVKILLFIKGGGGGGHETLFIITTWRGITCRIAILIQSV